VALGLALLCVLAAARIDSEAARRATMEDAAAESLRRLAFVAGLVDGGGVATRADPFGVVVVQQGGPNWIGDGVRDALARQSNFVEDQSAHLLRVQAATGPHVLSVQLRLWRQGWDVRGPQPVRVHYAPWLALVAGLLGVAVAASAQRVDVGVFAAGATAQLGVWTLPRPSSLGYIQLAGDGGPWSQRWGYSSLLSALDRGDPALLTAVLGGVLATSLVLVVFDHRRSAGQADALSLPAATLTAALFAVGGSAWIEAAARTSLGSVLMFPATLVALGALLGTWICVAWPRPSGRGAHA